MSNAKFVPAVTETKTIEVSPAMVVLELAIDEASKVRALVGRCVNGQLTRLYAQLDDLVREGHIERTFLPLDIPSIRFD